MRAPIDRNKALTIVPKLKIDYKPERKMLGFNGLGARPNTLGNIVAGIQFFKILACEERESQMSKTLNQKVISIMKSAQAIGKKSYNDKQNYRYVEAVDVIREVRSLMVEQGLRLRSEVTSIERQPCGKMTLATITIKYSLINAETGETETTMLIAEGADTGDKAINKAMMSGLKYFFRDTFMLEFADDAEATTSHDGYKQQKSNQYQQSASTRKTQQTQRQKPKTAAQTNPPLGEAWQAVAPDKGADKKENQRKRFFALCNERKISEKVQKLIVEFYTMKQSRADVTEAEYRDINQALPTLEKAALLKMAKTVHERKESKDKQAS
jgi:hypothetical protein